MKSLRPFVILAILIIAALAAAFQPAFAGDAATCYTISDMDGRNYCLAKASKQTSMCYAIQQAGLRAQCLAEVRG